MEILTEKLKDMGGGAPPGGGTAPGGNSAPGGSSGGSVTWSGATEIASSGSYAGQTYTSTTADQNAVLVSTSGNVTFTNPTVTKTGGSESAGDDYNFYGTNSAVMVKGGGTVTIIGGTINTGASGANAVFSYGGNGGQNGAAGDGTTVVITDTVIRTTGSGSGGIMTTGGGKTIASDLTIITDGQSSAPIRTDRGGGAVDVTDGSYTSNGLGSPAIYSTADITVTDAELTSNLSEGVCIEGSNSVTLNDCVLTANNTKTNGNATFLDSIMIYQSQSGDAASGTSTFTMTGGTLNSKSGHVFHVTNTTAVINLSNVNVNNADSDGVFLSVCDDGWSGAENAATLNASSQTISGDILVGSDSSLTLNLTNSSTFKGSVSGNILNSSGSSVSSSVGSVAVSLDGTSKWYLTEDTYISSFSGTAANVITGDYKLYVNNSALSGTTSSDSSSDTTLPSGLSYNTDKTAVSSGSSYSGTIDAGSYASSLVTIDASSSAGPVDITGNSNNNVIRASKGGGTLSGAGGNDTLYGGSGADVFKYAAGDGIDTIYSFDNAKDTVWLSGAADVNAALKAYDFEKESTDILISYDANDDYNNLTLKTVSSDVFYISTSAGISTINAADNATVNASVEEGIVYVAETIKVAATSSDAYLWLQNDGKVDVVDPELSVYTDVEDVDASAVSGKTIVFAGNETENITMGSGGGAAFGQGSNATNIYLGAGSDTVMWYSGSGNDVVYNMAAGDTVWLYASEDDYADVKVTTSGADLKVGFNGVNDALTIKNGASIAGQINFKLMQNMPDWVSQIDMSTLTVQGKTFSYNGSGGLKR